MPPTTPPPADDAPVGPVVPAALAVRYRARFGPDGTEFDAPADLPLLRAAELAGVKPMDSSCRNGTCRTCLCLLESGEVCYRIDWPGVSIDEKREGWILPCVAYPLSDVVVRLPL